MCYETEKTKVKLIAAGQHMAIVQESCNNFLWTCPIDRKMRKRVISAIKKNNWEIINVGDFTWLDDPSEMTILKAMQQVTLTKEPVQLKRYTIEWNEEIQMPVSVKNPE